VLINRTLRQYVDQSDVNNRCVQISAWPVRAIVAVTAYDRLGDLLLLDAADSSLKLRCRNLHILQLTGWLILVHRMQPFISR
jgi:hypothetical protein